MNEEIVDGYLRRLFHQQKFNGGENRKTLQHKEIVPLPYWSFQAGPRYMTGSSQMRGCGRAYIKIKWQENC